MTSVYVAGASSELYIASSYIDRLKAHGIDVTFDWTFPVRAAKKSDADLSTKERARHAFVDLDAVARCQFFWLVAPKPPNGSTGAWVELGHALALRKIVVVSGDASRCIFADLAHHRFAEHEGAFAFLTS